MTESQGPDIDVKGVYELAYHLVPSLDEAGRAGVVDELRKLIEENGGVILNEVYPEHLNLTYTMSKMIQGKYERFNTAFFGWINFELDRDQIEKIHNACKYHDSILRFLSVTTSKEVALSQHRYSFGSKDTEVAEADSKDENDDTNQEVDEEEVDEAIDKLVDDESKD